MSCYIHAVPGRMRLKIPSAKGNARLAEAIGEALARLEGVESVCARPLTGSVLVTYSPEKLDPRDILGLLSAKGFVDPERTATMDAYFQEGAAKAGKVLARAFVGAMMDQALAGSQLAFLSVLL